MPGEQIPSLPSSATARSPRRGLSPTAMVEARPRSLAEWRSRGADYAFDKGLDIGGVLLSILAAWLFVLFVARRIEHYGDEGHGAMHSARELRARTAARLLRSVARAVLLVVGVLMVLNQLDFNIGPLLASAGVVGLAVSFGSQSLVRDYVTGFFLQLEHQFAIGETIRVGTVEGVVEDISLRLVYLRDSTGALHIVPNGQIAQITNLSRAWGRVSVDVDVAWRDADRAAAAVRRAAEELASAPEFADALLEAPRVTGIEKLQGGTVTLRVVARVDPYRRDDVGRALRRHVLHALDHDVVAVVPAPTPSA